ncbi:ABC transporter ATP-binding protein [Psychrobacillus lasiicapitis]|uniref:sn-glycerol-3-phosphate ABC transporter ATP-binding protein UgpC n=1 Tax=Psychrobacillus lasiicapitis TaxID=1636719 RepID=A0A544T334_9BACI|nr:sn-glycerol-3-phosphate ABC transporter ATP-binding protein UgpC [Psychrobacillus lasiicapitis]TQR11824.1 sn-glycerol-3-phosphate ABC transporter ATP-binding protein UgpC [Psychrobacillus lasiicapitis]GGA19757.1 sugar ABC transporter ATP-binding protein [Psychrobacillus lasiicapitis]
MAELLLKNINKQYDKSIKGNAVTDFNLHVEDGEFIVLVGPSGCGKSTMLRMIAGLEEITDGEFFLDDKLMNDVPPANRGISMVFQNYALYPHMTVYDNIAFGLKIRKTNKKEIDRRVREAAEILGLQDLLKRKPSALSGGQKQRVALGRAIVREAKLFLMDEPLSNLDAKLRFQMRAEIAKLHQRLKTTSIYVTHDQTEAMTMATRIVIMKDGVIQQVGTPKTVYDYPENVFVGSFIGSPAMNFFSGKIVGNRFVSEGIELKVPQDKLAVLKGQGYDRETIVMGIRPEHIKMQTGLKGEPRFEHLRAKIVVSELTGSDMLLYSSIGPQEFIAQVESRTIVSPGEEVMLGFEMDCAHFYDEESGQRIKAEERLLEKISV